MKKVAGCQETQKRKKKRKATCPCCIHSIPRLACKEIRGKERRNAILRAHHSFMPGTGREGKKKGKKLINLSAALGVERKRSVNTKMD